MSVEGSRRIKYLEANCLIWATMRALLDWFTRDRVILLLMAAAWSYMAVAKGDTYGPFGQGESPKPTKRVDRVIVGIVGALIFVFAAFMTGWE